MRSLRASFSLFRSSMTFWILGAVKPRAKKNPIVIPMRRVNIGDMGFIFYALILRRNKIPVQRPGLFKYPFKQALAFLGRNPVPQKHQPDIGANAGFDEIVV